MVVQGGKAFRGCLESRARQDCVVNSEFQALLVEMESRGCQVRFALYFTYLSVPQFSVENFAKFRGPVCIIPRLTHGKIVQIPRLTAAFHLRVNCAIFCPETSVIEGCHCA